MSAKDSQKPDFDELYVWTADTPSDQLSDSSKVMLAMGEAFKESIGLSSENDGMGEQFKKDINRNGLDISVKGADGSVAGERTVSPMDSKQEWHAASQFLAEQITKQRPGGQLKASDLMAAKLILNASWKSQIPNSAEGVIKGALGSSGAMISNALTEEQDRLQQSGEEGVFREFEQKRLDINGRDLHGPGSGAKFSTKKTYQFQFDKQGELTGCRVAITASGTVESVYKEGDDLEITERVAYSATQNLAIGLDLKTQKATIQTESTELGIKGKSPLWDIAMDAGKAYQADPSNVVRYPKDNIDTVNAKINESKALNALKLKKQIMDSQTTIKNTVSPIATQVAQADLLKNCQAYISASNGSGAFADSCKMAEKLIKYAQTATPEQQQVASQGIAKLFAPDQDKKLGDAQLQQNQRECLAHLNNEKSQKVLKAPSKTSPAFIAVAVITALTGGLAAFGFAILAAQEKSKAAQLTGDLEGLQSKDTLPRNDAQTGLRDNQTPDWVATGSNTAPPILPPTGQGDTSPAADKNQKKRPKPPEPPPSSSFGTSA